MNCTQTAPLPPETRRRTTPPHRPAGCTPPQTARVMTQPCLTEPDQQRRRFPPPDGCLLAPQWCHFLTAEFCAGDAKYLLLRRHLRCCPPPATVHHPEVSPSRKNTPARDQKTPYRQQTCSPPLAAAPRSSQLYPQKNEHPWPRSSCCSPRQSSPRSSNPRSESKGQTASCKHPSLLSSACFPSQ
ncbi:hypothetical protein TCDM_12956 [Trypanosoma cruzi Dm28c]|uniref:Uncharacterized protein n=1 Tax=Trypanosoma cruzi Dm28c TaxID=1416333 RepID=V5APL6_TRYCR|nr:hypothetical protein TCDM_12956 [Trypanosoma cruzi Dm28c]